MFTEESQKLTTNDKTLSGSSRAKRSTPKNLTDSSMHPGVLLIYLNIVIRHDI